MHILTVRHRLVDDHSTLSAALYGAFEEARRLAAADLVNRDFSRRRGLPIARAMPAKSLRAIRRPTASTPTTVLDIMLKYAAADGLTTRQLGIDELLT